MTETRNEKLEIYCLDVYPSDPLEEEQKVEDETPNGRFICAMEYEGQDIEALIA